MKRPLRVAHSHEELRGRERLLTVVSCLGKSCPWTDSITSEKMLSYLESEVHELREEMIAIQSNVGSKCQKLAMLSELGDILFDVLMLEMLMRREYNFGIEEAWQIAAKKIERRTPYMTEWGDGLSVATNADDATAIWMAVKREENAAKQADGIATTISGIDFEPGIVATNPNRLFCWPKLKKHSNFFGGAVLGFAIGVIFRNKCIHHK